MGILVWEMSTTMTLLGESIAQHCAACLSMWRYVKPDLPPLAKTVHTLA